ncbi:hypothetical protein [Paraburkholderia sp. HD33-4]|uniref:hypothetical protein n=1 Tax=Paraburkholderia sp. HD33-4 TaxID=2883242 RepID=UPI001F2D81A5|nr:hypothetical protein [Paraburkholderia sp. HD33-4]
MFDFLETNEMNDREAVSGNRDLNEFSRSPNPYRTMLYFPLAELVSNVEAHPDVAHVAILGYN